MAIGQTSGPKQVAIGIDDAIAVGLKLIDKWFPTEAEKNTAKLKLFEAQQAGEFKQWDILAASDKNQADINVVEAGSDSFWKSGWRPAVGWTCAGGLFYQVIFRPIAGWLCKNAFGWEPPPSLEMDTLMTTLFGMLGLGAYRTYEKVKSK